MPTGIEKLKKKNKGWGPNRNASEIFPCRWPCVTCCMGKPRNHKHDPDTWPVCQYSRPRLTQEATKMTNVVFKGGTDNLKYNLGDRCVF